MADHVTEAVRLDRLDRPGPSDVTAGILHADTVVRELKNNLADSELAGVTRDWPLSKMSEI